ncbi:MAG: O-antigen ligase family protein, partial [Candidatus Sericytochromatia bacterium]|nr:O-antigen ligase family protein [Candidatus Sericytochromatia bacterium]
VAGDTAAWAGFTGRLARLQSGALVLTAAGLGVALASSLQATDMARSLVNTWLFASYITCFWLAYTGTRTWGRGWLAWSLAIAAIGMAAGGLFIDAFLTTYAGFGVASVPKFTFPLGNKNFTASFFLLVWPFFVAFAQQQFDGSKKTLLYVGAALSLVCLVGSESRSAYLAAAVQLVLLALLLGGSMRQALVGISRKTWLIVGSVVVVGTIVATPLLVNRFSSMAQIFTDVSAGGKVADNSFAMRLEMWRGALTGLQFHPIFGSGMGSVPSQFPLDRMQTPRYPDVVNPQLHSTVFHVLYELGLAGVAVLLAMAGFLFWRTVKAVRRTEVPIEALGIAVGLFGYGFSLLTDFQWEVPSMTLAFVLSAALLVDGGEPDAKETTVVPSRPVSLVGGLLGTLVVLGGLYMMATKDRAAIAYDDGHQSFQRSEYATGMKAWREAVQLDPTFPFYKVALGSTLSYLYLDQPETPANKRLWQEALGLLTDANKTYHLASANIKEGNLRVKLGDAKGAIAPLTAATTLTWYAPVPHFYLGEAYRALGDRPAAIKAYAMAIYHSPSLVWAAHWETKDGAPYKQDVAKAALALYQSSPNPTSWQLLHMGQLQVMADDRAGAETNLTKLIATDPAYRNQATTWMGEAAFQAKDWPAAAKAFGDAFTMEPGNAYAQMRLAQAKVQLGDAGAAKDGLLVLSKTFGQNATEEQIKVPSVMAHASIPIGFDTRKGWSNMAFRRAAPEEPFPNPISVRPEGMFFLNDEKPWPELPRLTARSLATKAP